MMLEIKRTVTIVVSEETAVDGIVASRSITVDAEEFEKIIRKMVNTPPLPLKTLVKMNRRNGRRSRDVIR
jgi:hypothetical protein